MAGPKEVASLIELVNSEFDSKILETLRIYNNDKVKLFNHILVNERSLV